MWKKNPQTNQTQNIVLEVDFTAACTVHKSLYLILCSFEVPGISVAGETMGMLLLWEGTRVRGQAVLQSYLQAKLLDPSLREIC